MCADDALDQAAAPVIEAILKSAPEAARASKALVLAQAGLELSDQQVEALAVQAAAGAPPPRRRRGSRALARSAILVVRGITAMKLEGIKVVDLSLFLPGPAMTQVMADHGAEVIKVEPLPAGEPIARSARSATACRCISPIPIAGSRP